jgi:putative MATE family efflux protein
MDIAYSGVNVRRKIYKLAWPTIIEQMLIMLVGIVSTIFVSRLGREIITAVGMVNMLMNFFQTLFAGLATGTTIIVARVTGESGVEKAKNALLQSMLMGAVVGVIFTIINMLLSNNIIAIFFGGAEREVIQYAELYYKIILIGVPFLIIDMIISGALRGAGDTKSPMYVTAIVNVINALLSLILIFGADFGYFSVPALGVKGAALAVMIARICGGIMRVALLFWKGSKISLTFKDRFKLNPKLMKRIIRVGIPSFTENLILQGGFLVLQILVVRFGTLAAAGYQIGGNIHSLAFMPIWGFAITTTTTVGQSLGKKEYKSAEAYAYENKRIATFVGIIAGLFMFIFAEPLVSMYTNDPELIRSSVLVVRGFAIIEPFMGIEKVCAAAIRSAGDIRYVLITAVVALWTFRVGTAYLLNHFFGLGLYGVIIGIFLDFCVRAVMYTYRLKAGKWKYLKI